MRSPFGAALIAGALVGSASTTAAAQSPGSPPRLPTDPTLAKLIEESLASRPDVAEAEALVQAQSERASQAGAWPDPMLEAGIQNDGFSSIEIGKMEGSFVSIMASQTFPWPGKPGLRTEIAELDTRRARSAVTRARLTTEADVRRAYLDLLLARDRLALLDRLQDIWQSSAGVARARYEAGDGAQSDVLRSQLELNRIKQRRLAIEVEERTSVQTLNRLRGAAFDAAIATSTHTRDLAVPELGDEQAALEDAHARSPELAAARLGVAVSDRAVSLAEKSYYPDLVVGAGIMIRGGDFPHMWQLTVGGTLPIFAGAKQNRAIAESEARTLAEQKRLEAIAQVLRLRVAERRVALSALIETVRLYREGLLIQSEATAKSTLAQYQVGKVSFASVLDANAGYIADEDGYLQSITDAHRILVAAAEVSLESVVTRGSGVMGGSSMPGASSMGGGSPGGMTRTGGGEPSSAPSSADSPM